MTTVDIRPAGLKSDVGQVYNETGLLPHVSTFDIIEVRQIVHGYFNVIIRLPSGGLYGSGSEHLVDTTPIFLEDIFEMLVLSQK